MSPRFGEGKEADASPLTKPLHFEFSNKTAPNRFLKAAMTERLSSWDPKDLEKRGTPTDNLINVYKRWGEGGFGAILTGNIMVDPVNLEAPGNMIIPKSAPFSGPRFEAFKKLGQVSKAHGALIVGQISHPGRQVGEQLQPDPVSASDIQLDKEVMGMKFAKPHPASEKEIEDIKADFVHAAEYLYHAGYDGIQLHGAHGYLLAQFLSQTTNKRKDNYGGSLQNRSRIMVEISRDIRNKVPASTGFMVGAKINSVEFQEGGFTTEEAAELCSALEKDAEFDFVELSGGTYESLAFGHKKDSTKQREAFFLEMADQIAPRLNKTKTYVTGGLRTVGAMIKALDVVDGVGLARPSCQEFHLPQDIIDKKVRDGAINPKLDQGDFGTTNMAAGTQIRQVGKDQEPIDLSQQKNLEVFQKSMEAWSKGMAEDKEGKKFGYIDLQGYEASAYSAAA